MRTPWICPVAMNLRTERRSAARARNVLWRPSCKWLRAPCALWRCDAEAKFEEVMRAGRGDSGGFDENSGNARREDQGPLRVIATAKPVGGAIVNRATRARYERARLPAAADLALAGAAGATIRAEFPDPPSDVLRASADLATEGAGHATERVAFPDPPSDALRSSPGFAVEQAGRATERFGFPDPPSSTPVPITQADAEDDKGRDDTRDSAGDSDCRGSAAAWRHFRAQHADNRYNRLARHARPWQNPQSRSPERTWQRKNRQVRHLLGYRNEANDGRTGKSATPLGSSNEPGTKETEEPSSLLILA
jgi:hypothetical protein